MGGSVLCSCPLVAAVLFCRAFCLWVLILSENSLAFKIGRSKDPTTTHPEDANKGKIWKTLSKLPTLSKIRIFRWRVCHEAIPTREKLKKARLSEGSCPLCGSELETTIHALKNCPKMRAILQISGLNPSIIDWQGTSYKDWNKWLHDEETQDDRDVMVVVWGLCADFVKANSIGTFPTPSQNSMKSTFWSCPKTNGVKINVDGAFSTTKAISVIGIVAIDHNGMVLGGMRRQITPPFTTESTEVEAFTQGLKFAMENGWMDTIIEGDTIFIVN
ncbi:uncharacterized protein LOC120157868 [Hibiscus syriacus]|uniref:uncharacterized protein LOC120157868 n=1 Tax=Hibiscus syriacus TaxID=106335 RepID=UPI0019213E0B|nr:uncharacterized protein LOC120157868 [Hibiscus syriacus]